MILLTGASGLIGSALTEQLLADGHELRVQVRDKSSLQDYNGRVQVRQADFNQFSQNEFACLVDGCQTVIHAAALVHQPEAPFQAYELLNVRTTSQLASAAMAAGVNDFVFFSTVAVYGEGPFENAREDQPLKPVTPYAVSKANSERDLEGLGGFKRLIVLRPAMVFGEGDRGNLIKLIRQLRKGRFFHIGGQEARKSLIYRRDVAAATAACLSALPPGRHTLNLANPEAVSLKQLTSLISSCLGASRRYPTLPRALAKAVVSAAQAILGAATPVRWEQIERLNTTATVSVERLLQSTNFACRWQLKDALEQEVKWAASAGLL